MHPLLKTLVISGIVMSLNGCASRTVTVVDTSTDIVRLDAPTGPVPVSRYVGNGKWEHIGKMILPAGGIYGPGPVGGIK